MPVDNSRSAASICGRPIYATLVPIPIVCFLGTFLTDIAYWKTANMQWANMSVWALTIGLVVSAFAVLAGLADFTGDARVRALRSAWIHGLSGGLAIILSIFNAFIHSRDAYTSVVPTGLTLSGLVVLLLLVTGWNGWTMVNRVGGRQEKVQ